MATTQQTSDFVIMGPPMEAGSRVVDAVHALYFLPENFKLILTGGKTADQSLYKQVLSLVKRDDLGDRVRFDGTAGKPNAVIAPDGVTGDSPEALASAILNAARARA